MSMTVPIAFGMVQTLMSKRPKRYFGFYSYNLLMPHICYVSAAWIAPSGNLQKILCSLILSECLI